MALRTRRGENIIFGDGGRGMVLGPLYRPVLFHFLLHTISPHEVPIQVTIFKYGTGIAEKNLLVGLF